MRTPAICKRELAAEAAHALAGNPRVVALALFGSVARGTATISSDIDLLVLTDGGVERPSQVREGLPVHLHDPTISISTFTESSLRAYLLTWSRFAMHLQREGVVLLDPTGVLRSILAERIDVSVAHELSVQRKHLENLAHLDRFGGRFLFPLARLHGIGRAVIFASLTRYGRFEFEREKAFAELKGFAPRLARDVDVVEAIEPFYRCVRESGSAHDLPFSPWGSVAGDRVVEARDAVARILAAGGPAV